MSQLRPDASALAKLRRLVRGESWVALDTETTDLGPLAELVELAIVGAGGRVFHTLVRPSTTVSAAAARTHKIDAEALSAAPPFAQIAQEVRRRLEGRSVLCYHADFDRRVIWRAFAAASQPAPACRWVCLCDVLTRWGGRRLSLDLALERVGVEAPGQRHRAMPDAQAVVALARALAETGEEG